MLACSAEFANAGTLRSLERTYGFHLEPHQKIVLAGGETAATIGAAAARTNRANTAMVYGTDGGIVAADLVLLEDDKRDQPVYAPVPIVRDAVLQAHPGIAGIVRPLMQSFTRDSLQALNARVQIDGEAPEAVAADYLQHQGLLALALRARAKRGDGRIATYRWSGSVLSCHGRCGARVPAVRRVQGQTASFPVSHARCSTCCRSRRSWRFYAALILAVATALFVTSPRLRLCVGLAGTRRRRGRRRCGRRRADTAGQSRGARRAGRRVLGASQSRSGCSQPTH